MPTSCTLIRPPTLISKYSNTGPLTPPLGVAYLAAAARNAGHHIVIIDAVGEDPFLSTAIAGTTLYAIGLSHDEIVRRIAPGVICVGITCMFSHEWPYVRLLIQKIRAQFPCAFLVMGGEHVTALPEEVLADASGVDICVIGEGEETFVQILNLPRLAQGEAPSSEDLASIEGIAYRVAHQGVVRTPPRRRIRAIDTIAPPAWDLTPIEKYLEHHLGYGVDRGRSMPILATRGCPYQCTFCSNPMMWTTRWIPRAPSLVIEEIEHYLTKYHATNIDFYDLTAIVEKEWILEFCRLIQERKLHFSWQLPSGTRSEAIDSEVAHMLRLSGCSNMNYAPESGSSYVLTEIKKKVDLSKMIESMRATLREGLNLKANIIIGFPQERRRDILATLYFIVRLACIGVHDVAVSIFSPYPGSSLFMAMRKEEDIREYTDEYYYSLISYTDMIAIRSWCKAISGAELWIWRLLAYLCFYGLQFALRPYRLYELVTHYRKGEQVSRLDKSLQDYRKRVRGMKKLGREIEY